MKNSNNLPEEQDANAYIGRPQGNRGALVSGMTGRYELPKTAPAPGPYFGSREKYERNQPEEDGKLPYKMIGPEVGGKR